MLRDWLVNNYGENFTKKKFLSGTPYIVYSYLIITEDWDYYSHVTEKETEAQNGQVACARSHS